MQPTIDLHSQRQRDAADDNTVATAIVCAVFFLVIGVFLAWLAAHGAFAPTLWAGDVS